MRIISAEKFPKKRINEFDKSDVDKVRRIISDVKRYGDEAVIKYTERFDKVRLTKDKLRVKESEILSSLKHVDKDLKRAIDIAKRNLEIFSKYQLKSIKNFTISTSKGVFCSQRIIPIERVGIYVPAGNFPLISTLLMCAIPAQIAGVREIVVVSPPRDSGDIHSAILQAAALIGVNEIYRIGGVQAIASLALGTETIKPVNKIVGPGNKYVSIAKMEVSNLTGIDMLAGPSEVMIIADNSSNPTFIAADMIAQAEHDINASAILLTTSKFLADKVILELEKQIEQNLSKEIIKKSLNKNGFIVICKSLDQCVDIANSFAPEHLEIAIRDSKKIIKKLVNYGSLFVGEYSAEVFGDYTAGVNHTLPTNGFSRVRGGLSVYDFLKIHTEVKINKTGLKSLLEPTLRLSSVEGLVGHFNAAKVRGIKIDM